MVFSAVCLGTPPEHSTPFQDRFRGLSKRLNLKRDLSIARASKAQDWYLHEAGTPRLVGTARCLTLGCTKARGWFSYWDRWGHGCSIQPGSLWGSIPHCCLQHMAQSQTLFINGTRVDWLEKGKPRLYFYTEYGGFCLLVCLF